MCKRFMVIKNTCQAGITSAYIPCGKCVDCRRDMARAWSFRLNSEFLHLKKKGWNLAFCTLTYRSEDLPVMPRDCFVDESQYREIPCFDKSAVRQFIMDLRMEFKHSPFEFVGDNRMRYFVATEFGTKKHRPHLHMLLAWPNTVSYETMHAKCTELWRYGKLFPEDYRGDSETGCLPFEIIGDASKCLTYCSKYVCKDLALLDLQKGVEFYDKRKQYEENSDEMRRYYLWRNCQSFHLQSQSLGYEAIKNLSDDEKMDIYRHGLYFSSDKDAKPQQVPMYIKNKLIFDPWYVVDDNGKRLVRRRASDFFLRHAHEIFDMKAEFYTKYCAQSESVEYYTSRGLDEKLARHIYKEISIARSRVDGYGIDFAQGNVMGEYYLAYNRVSNLYSYNIERCNQWLLRYYPDVTLTPRYSVNPYLNGSDTFDNMLYDLKCYWALVDKANALLGSVGAPQREEDERIKNEILEYFNYEVKNVL